MGDWIKDKARLLTPAADDSEKDLAGVLALQRKLSTMERDLAAIQVKLIQDRSFTHTSCTHPSVNNLTLQVVFSNNLLYLKR